MVQLFDRDIVLQERIAAGGMAEVFRAQWIGIDQFQKTVALKRVLKHHANKQEFKDMFRKEAILSSHLQHPNIVQIYRNGEWDGFLYLVLEYVNGKNLRQLLGAADRKKMRIPVAHTIHIMSEIAQGLGYAHNLHDEHTGKALNIIHRDMSPQNVMLTYDGQIKIVDFGIAKAALEIGEETKVGVLKGKFGYMSPEQAEGRSIDGRTDVFASGVLFFELLTQRRLFTTKDDLKTLRLVQECKIPKPSKFNPAIDEELDRIVLKALAKNPAQRYLSADDFHQDLKRYLNSRFPEFRTRDVATFLAEIFSDKIAQERKERDQLNQAARELLAASQNKGSSQIATAAATVQMGDKASTAAQLHAAQKKAVAGGAPGIQVDATHEMATQLRASEAEVLELILESGSSPQTNPAGRLKGQTNVGGPFVRPKEQSEVRSVSQWRVRTPQWLRPATVMGLLALGGYWAYENFGVAVGPNRGWVSKISSQMDRWFQSDAKSPQLGAARTVEQSENMPTSNSGVEHQARGEKSQGIPSATSGRRVSSVDAFQQAPKPVQGYLSIFPPVHSFDEIRINGKVVTNSDGFGLVTPMKRLKLNPGTYSIELRNAKLGITWKKEVHIQENYETLIRDVSF